MTTRSALVTDISDWTIDTSLTTSVIDTFIRMAESDIRRKVRVIQMMTVDDTFTMTSRTQALPTRWISFISVSADASGNRAMDYLPPARLRESRIWDESAGTPKAYTVEGGNIVVAPAAPSTGQDLQLVYWAAFETLTDPADTNWLLTNHYDVYLFACLTHAFAYAQDDEQAAKYKGLFQGACDQLNIAEQWARVGTMKRTGGASTP